MSLSRVLKNDGLVPFIILLCGLACVLVILLVLFSMFYTIIFDESVALYPCLSEHCLVFFEKKFRMSISVIVGFSKVLAFLITAFGVYAAFSQYRHAVSTGNLNNHFRNIEIFNNSVLARVEASKHFKSRNVDLKKLYTLIFPKSKVGKFDFFDGYLRIVGGFRRYLINRSTNAKSTDNFHFSSNTSFRKHRAEVIKFAKMLGFDVKETSMYDFYSIEDELIMLVDEVTGLFVDNLSLQYQLATVKRHYR